MGLALVWMGQRLARFLTHTTHVHGTGPATRPDHLLASLQAGDVLLVEGSSRVSTAIKYLTQSTWSHAVLYVGPHLISTGGDPEHYCFIQADILDCRRLTAFAITRLGINTICATSSTLHAICCQHHPCRYVFIVSCLRWVMVTRSERFAPR